MSDPETPEKKRQNDRHETEPAADARMPFDISELSRIPTATGDDPPYKNWWIDDDR